MRYHLPLPQCLSIEENYEGVVDFVEELRRVGVGRGQRIYTDFRTLEKIGTAGALILVSELDRWRRVRNTPLMAVDVSQWDQQVRRLLDEMGLFAILNVINPPPSEPPLQEDIKFVRFRTGNRAFGEDARKLQIAIEEVTGAIPSRRTLYRGLSEAMTNAVHHAYPDDFDYQTKPLSGQWWMLGSFDNSQKRLTVAFYDQGVGIPFTLPRKHKVEKIKGLLDFLRLRDDDASRIRCAMELGRSQTEEDHRGGGLFRDIRNHTKMVPDGRLRVLSGKGEYIYQPSNEDENQRERLLTHKKEFGGTLIQWEATLNEEAE